MTFEEASGHLISRMGMDHGLYNISQQIGAYGKKIIIVNLEPGKYPYEMPSHIGGFDIEYRRLSND